MQRAFPFRERFVWRPAVLAVWLVAFLLGCGGGGPQDTTNQPAPASTLKLQAFISNQAVSTGASSGQVLVIDASKDLVAAIVAVGGLPTMMALAPDKTKLVAYDSESNSISVVSVSKETVNGTLPLGDIARSIVYLSDSNTLLAALRNTGQVAFIDTTAGTVTANVAVPAVRTLVRANSAAKALAFQDTVRDTFYIVDTSAKTATAVTNSALDFPIYGVFSSDDTKAFILSCGPECGGTTAKVSVVDIASGTISQTITVSAATVALLDGTKLYVAGTQGSSGKLDVVDVSSMSVTTRGVTISDGFHQVMALGSNNRLYIGARTCNNVTTGCLSTFNTSGNSAIIDTPHGDVTGLQPIPTRNIVYVIEGGELRIMQTANDAEQTFPSIDIVGKAVDVKLLQQ